jgi:hypothetical protein
MVLMDNQQSTTVPGQVGQTPVMQQPSFAPQLPSRQKSKGKTILVAFLFVLLLGGLGFLGYTYKSTNDALKQKSQELSKAYGTIGDFQVIINKQEAVDSFTAEQNDEILSRNLCGGTPVGMFDVHLNNQFGVFRYLCSQLKSAAPIRTGALKKLDNGSYQFTYGSSDASPNALPGYIYDSEPDFFASYGATRF